MKNRLINKITGNLLLKIIALVVAFLIWLLVTNTNNPVKSRTISNVPINVTHQDSVADIGKVVDIEGSGTVTLKVSERRYIVDRLTASDFYVEADLENINEMNSVPLTVSCTNKSVTWDEVEIYPTNLKVNLEDKVEQQFVVSTITTGNVANGFNVGSTEIVQGKNIYIAGPESVVKIINQVVAQVNTSGLNSDMTLTAPLKLYDKNGQEMDDNQLSSLEFKDGNGALITDRIVQVKVNMWRVRNDIALEVNTVGIPAFGYRVAGIETVPVNISLAGTEEALSALGGKLTVADEISVTGAKENITQEIDLTNTLSQMEGLKLSTSADPNIIVEVQIEKTGDVTFSIPISNITLVNKPTGMNLVVTPADKVSISVHAVDGDASNLTEKDVKVSMDLSPCAEEGSYEIPVIVELPEGYELAGDVSVIVNSTKQAEEVQTEEAE